MRPPTASDVNVEGGGMIMENNGRDNGTRNNNKKVTTVINEQYPDPAYSYIPPIYFHELDKASKELEEMIEGIPDDLGTRNTKYIIRLGLTIGRLLVRSGYLGHLFAMNHARLADLNSIWMTREYLVEKDKALNTNTILEKLEEIPTRNDLTSTIAQYASSIAAASSSSTATASSDLSSARQIELERKLKLAEEMTRASDKIVESTLEKAVENLSTIAAQRINNIQEDPLKTRLAELMGTFIDSLMMQTKLPLKKEGVDARQVFNIVNTTSNTNSSNSSSSSSSSSSTNSI
ncbi:MAG: hypothetical protein QXF17_04325 [Ignisphaera sp.]